jgi:hypothetical protein
VEEKKEEKKVRISEEKGREEKVKKIMEMRKLIEIRKVTVYQ